MRIRGLVAAAEPPSQFAETANCHPRLWRGVVLLMGSLCIAAHSAQDQAKAILDAAGVQGGLIVHLGCGDGKLTAALRASESYLVHGLDADAANLAKARDHIRKAGGLYGVVSVDLLKGKRLPYAENLVNLAVVEDARVPMAEVMRVLCPDGVAYTKRNGKWTKAVKPRPKDIDEWTHFLHSPTNNAVSQDDRVGPPQHVQWIAEPRWARSHDHLATVSAVVSAGGRLFSIVDEGPTVAVVLPPKWFLVARDAYSGVLLWKRKIPVWEWHLRGFRSGPPEIARRLVAHGDRVYVTLGYGAPVSVLDGATGKTLKTYEGTDDTQEFLLCDGKLFLVVGKLDDARRAALEKRRTTVELRPQRPAYRIKPPIKHIQVVDAKTGSLVWKKADADTAELMPTTLAVASDRCYFQSAGHVICLDAGTGREAWRAERPTARARPAWTAPTLVVYGDVVLSADRAAAAKPKEPGDRKVEWTVTSSGGQAPVGDLIAYAAKTGKRLWSSKCQECYNAPVDVLVTGGLVWTGNLVRANQPGITQGLDPLTGEVKRTRPKDQTFYAIGMGHQRCYRNKATSRWLVLGRSGTEFIDVATGKAIANHWTRGTCQYGVLPCNGLLYTPSHSCACFPEAKIDGFNCLAPARRLQVPGSGLQETPAARLERGPAYADSPKPGTGDPEPAAWPTYRHDPARSGCTSSPVPSNVTQLWQAAIGGKLSSLVVGEGRLLIAQVDAHTVHALDPATGKPVWRYTAGGRVDSPPTLHQGRALFGSADGWVYCLRASDGALAWRFRAAPEERRVVSYGQLESAWPVHGSVLVADGVVSCTAGRSSYLDGGIRLCRIDVKTGKLLSERRIDHRDPETGYQRKGVVRGTTMPGVLSDILTSDGTSIYLRHLRFSPAGEPQPSDVPHLYSPAGFLDDSWWHRTYWMVGTRIGSNYGGWPHVGNRVPAGRLLVRAGATVYGFGRNHYIHHGSHVGIDGATVFHFRGPRDSAHRETHYRLFRAAMAAPTPQPQPKGKRGSTGSPRPEPAEGRRRPAQPQRAYLWQTRVPIFVQAMVLAGDTLFAAGVPNPITQATGERGSTGSPRPEPAEGRRPARLLAVATKDGKTLSEFTLDSPPVFDGLIAARGSPPDGGELGSLPATGKLRPPVAGGGRLYMATRNGTVRCFAGEAK